jgi:Pentapeptide repeats (8 copies)
MVETLLAPSTIKLYGRVVKDLSYKYDPESVVTGVNHFLQNQLATGAAVPNLSGIATANSNSVTGVNSLAGLHPGMTVSATYQGNQVFNASTTILSLGPTLNSFSISSNPANATGGNAVPIVAVFPNTEPNFARIYAFTFEGAIYTLPRPSIFLVHGAGAALDITNANTAANQVNRSTMDQAGVIAREWEFSASQPLGQQSDLRYWEYEKGDFSLRLDPEAGPLEQILLVAALRGGADMADRATAIRSGASLAGASLSGASLSGASLSGASLSGASLSGASLSGASLRGR